MSTCIMLKYMQTYTYTYTYKLVKAIVSPINTQKGLEPVTFNQKPAFLTKIHFLIKMHCLY